MWKKARILIVDDQDTNIFILERILKQAGYDNLKSTSDPRRVLPLYTEFQPDLILLDLMMPHLDGFAIMKQLEPRIPEGAYLPVLVLTADVTPETRQKALSMGAKDFLTKPFDNVEALLRIKNLLETRFLYLQIQNQNQVLEEKVRERTRDLEDAQIEVIKRLALAAEYCDDGTSQHIQRVGRLSALVAKTLGLSEVQVKLIRHAATLHDVGKIGVPDQILLKPDKLTPQEFAAVKAHITIGAGILSGSRIPLLQAAEEVALTHHEYWDGTGYLGLKEEEIPLSGRIVAVVDVFDVLTRERPYKEAWTEDKAATEIERQSGRLFDPRVVGALLQVLERKEHLKPEEEDSTSL